MTKATTTALVRPIFIVLFRSNSLEQLSLEIDDLYFVKTALSDILFSFLILVWEKLFCSGNDLTLESRLGQSNANWPSSIELSWGCKL